MGVLWRRWGEVWLSEVQGEAETQAVDDLDLDEVHLRTHTPRTSAIGTPVVDNSYDGTSLHVFSGF